MELDKKPSRMLRAALLLLLLLSGMTQALAWDTEPDENGLYDGSYSRPTHFPEFTEPTAWPNNQMYLLSVRFGDENGEPVENYEVAAYDASGDLRSCNRSITKQNHYCVLSVKGTETDIFHFQVIYGDFAHPTIVDVPDVTIKFKSNEVLGSAESPYIFVIPGRTRLSETDTALPGSKTGVDVTVQRTINANEWSTICLPFAIPEDKLNDAFGTTVQLGNFTGCNVSYEEDEETVKLINVKFEAATAIEANHPYIIKVQDAVTEINMDGVDIEAEDEPSVDCDPYPYQVQVGKNKWETHYWYNSFIGNYENGFLVPAQTLFLSGGKFYYSTGLTSMMAFRAYFDFYDVLPDAESTARISMTFNEETGIVSDLLDVCPSAESSQVYDLQGRQIVNSHSVNRKLQRGIYIKNNKKVFVK